MVIHKSAAPIDGSALISRHSPAPGGKSMEKYIVIDQKLNIL